MPLKGGKRFARHLREQRRKVDALRGKTVEAGFLSPHVSNLAAVHEFGAGDVPARPAFRRAEPNAKQAIRQRLRRAGGLPTEADLKEAGEAAAAEIKRSYEDADFVPLSERQRQRKAGTPYQDRQLVGHEGEKLISHIKARVVGRGDE